MRVLARLAVAAATVALAALPASAAFRLEKNLALAPGGRLAVDADAGSVAVVGSSTSGVHVVVTAESESIADDWTFDFQELSGEVRVVARRKGAGTSWFGGIFRSGKTPRFAIETPAATEVSIDTGGGSIQVDKIEGGILADTSGGSIAVTDCRGNAKLDTSGGGIAVNRLDGSLLADTSGGSIKVTDVSGDAKVSTSGGSILLDGIAGLVDADTSGGSIRAVFGKGNSRGGRLETSGGSIRVALDPKASLQIDAEASGGGVSWDLPIETTGKPGRGHMTGKLNGGGAMLRVETSGGSIQIVPIEP